MATQISTKQTKPEAKPEPKPIQLRAVYGRMVQPFTHEEFNVNTLTTVATIDSWTQAQLDSGKLVHGTD